MTVREINIRILRDGGRIEAWGSVHFHGVPSPVVVHAAVNERAIRERIEEQAVSGEIEVGREPLLVSKQFPPAQAIKFLRAWRRGRVPQKTAKEYEAYAQWRKGLPKDYVFGSPFQQWLKKTARKIARWKVWKKIGDAIKKVVTSPVVAGILGVASTIFPVIAPVYVAARAAIAVVNKVKAGDAKAIKGAQTLASASKSSPLAAQAVDALKAAQSSPLASFVPAV